MLNYQGEHTGNIYMTDNCPCIKFVAKTSCQLPETKSCRFSKLAMGENEWHCI